MSEEKRAVETGDQLSAALFAAVETGSVEDVDLLLRRGADVNITDARGCSVLHLAVIRDDAMIAAHLLHAGVPVNVQDSGGLTPLHHCCKNASYAVLDVLAHYGADHTVRDHMRLTPADYARSLGHILFAKTLERTFDIRSPG